MLAPLLRTHQGPLCHALRLTHRPSRRSFRLNAVADGRRTRTPDQPALQPPPRQQASDSRRSCSSSRPWSLNLGIDQNKNISIHKKNEIDISYNWRTTPTNSDRMVFVAGLAVWYVLLWYWLLGLPCDVCYWAFRLIFVAGIAVRSWLLGVPCDICCWECRVIFVAGIAVWYVLLGLVAWNQGIKVLCVYALSSQQS